MTATYNARPGAKAGTVARVSHVRMSATKARAVLDLIRGAEVGAAEDILRFCERDAAIVIGKLLHSAVANAEHNDDQIADDLFISTCYADEGRTIRRFRPRARGRATRIRKRTCHITIVVARLSEEQLERRRRRQESRPGTRGSRRAGQEAAEEAKSGRTRRRRSKSKTVSDETSSDETPPESSASESAPQAPSQAQSEVDTSPEPPEDRDEAQTTEAPSTAADEETTSPAEGDTPAEGDEDDDLGLFTDDAGSPSADEEER